MKNNITRVKASELNSIEQELLSNASSLFHLKTLLGFGLQSGGIKLFRLQSKLMFAQVSPFVYALDCLNINELEACLTFFQNNFVIPTKNQIDFSSSDLSEKNIYIQKRKHFQNLNFNKIKLEENIKSLDSSFKIRSITENDYKNILKNNLFINHLRHFKSYNDFCIKGEGSIACMNDQIVSITSSFCNFNNHLETQADTLVNFRRKRLSISTSSHYIINSMKKNKVPTWDAATEISYKLGKKLGFEQEVEYIMYHQNVL